eukprot:TRINITY_DN103031_c0_g1_i1.p1 TRINITY_DN103031_c0_g1~~TRINITY_DN103031_c0_g1_i1.p1  ORF type:complete len:538 (+),score=87.77 TRINITY_DN103031_c0_g1_i1:24-1637(+)
MLARVALLLLPLLVGAQPTYDSDVLILGAGISGITAGRDLANAGITNIRIVEADSAIGGRIRSVQWQGTTINDGASWIHGKTSENPIWVIKEKINLQCTDHNYDWGYWYNENGVQNDLLPEDEQVDWDRLEGYLEFLEQERDRRLENCLPDINQRALMNMYGMHLDLLNPINELAIWFDIDYCFADPPVQDSVRYSGMPYPGGDCFVTDTRGMRGIIDSIHDEYLTPNDPRLHLNTNIERIETTENGVRAIATDGTVFTARYGIHTFSPGVTQNDIVTFDPPLASAQRELVEQIPVTEYTGIYMHFPEDFWTDYVPPSDYSDYYDGPAHYYMIANNRRGWLPLYFNLDNPEFWPGSRIWRTDVASDTAREIQRMTDDEIKDAIVEQLSKVFPNVPRPDDVFITRHLQDPQFKGSFVNWPINDWQIWDVMELSKPHGKLYFGGSHLSEDHGFLSGGYWSGVEVARRVSSIINNDWQCGDGVCSMPVESCSSCVEDCGVCRLKDVCVRKGPIYAPACPGCKSSSTITFNNYQGQQSCRA